MKTKFSQIKKILKDEPDYRYQQVLDSIFQQKIRKYSQMKLLPKEIRKKLSHNLDNEVLSLKVINKASDDQTEKYLFELQDGQKIEAVKMKFQGDTQWSSLCISSQVGCGLNCKFCATGKISLKRDLTIDEIIDQILFFYLKDEEPKNILFMGMGEPLLNPNIYEAINVLTKQKLFNIGYRRISLSTVGIIPELENFIKAFPQINIAFSLHTPFNQQRNKLMPINKKYPLNDVLEVLDNYIKEHKRKVFIEYLLMDKVNDTEKHLDGLINLINGSQLNGKAKKLRKEINYLYHVNLIRYHSSEVENTYQSSPNTDSFLKGLQEAGISSTLRQSFGKDIEAGCGQLYAEYKD